MTLGEKLREYRNIFGLSQEKLAEKINVSRQAITKWENDEGIPDISNLKELSKIFGVSVDYLLDDTLQIETPILKERIILEKNTFSKRYDYVLDYLKENYSDSNIYGLTELRKDKNKVFNIVDFLSLKVISFVEWLNDPAIWFIVEKKTQNLIVKATKEYIEIRELSSVVDTNKFTFDDAKLMRINKKL